MENFIKWQKYLEKKGHDTYFLHIVNMAKLVLSDGNHSAIEGLSDGNIGLSVFKFATFAI